MTKYDRVLLKLSGEEFGGGKLGVDPDVVARIAGEIAAVSRAGVQIAIVIGGGNFFRGAELRQRGMDGVRADYMGMLGIVMNCLALQEFLEQRGVVTRVHIGLALMGFCFAPMFPLLMSLTPGRVGRLAAHQAIGFQVSAACLGAAGVPGLTGLLAQMRDWKVIGPALLAVALLLFLVHEAIAQHRAGRRRR